MSMDISTRLINVIKDVLEFNCEDNVQLDDNLGELGVNSTNFIKLVVALENEFGIEFETDQLNYALFVSVKSIEEHITMKLG